jgi:hypothetical protein
MMLMFESSVKPLNVRFFCRQFFRIPKALKDISRTVSPREYERSVEWVGVCVEDTLSVVLESTFLAKK